MKALMLLFLILCFGSLVYGQASEWVKFSSAEGNFSVSLPTEPTLQAGESEITPKDARTGAPLAKKVRAATKLFLSRGEGEAYMVGWADYEAGFTFDTNGELLANRDNFVKGLGAELVTEKKITFGSSPGLEFTAKKDTTFFRSRVYIFGRRPYLLVAVSGNPDVPNANKFFSSFVFTKK